MNSVLYYAAVMSIVLFVVMCADKAAAKRGAWRVPEKTLLTLAIIGGSAGGLAAMYLVRHKTKKPLFSIGFPVIFLVQAALYYLVLAPNAA